MHEPRHLMYAHRNLALLFAMILLAGAATVQGATLPPSTGEPTPVTVGINVIDVTNIDEIRRTFDIEFDVVVSWRDPRLAFAAADSGRDNLVYVGGQVDQVHRDTWSAQIVAANPVGQPSIGSKKLTRYADGRMRLLVRLNATLRAELDYRRFPFDKQILPIELESFAWNRDQVVLVADEAHSGFGGRFGLAEWSVGELEHRTGEALRLRDETPVATLVYEVEIQRHSSYYLLKIFMTVLIIVSLSWVVFWMSDEGLGRRAGIATSGILTVIAYQYVTMSSLPRVGYLTVADRVMILSVVFIALTMLESIIVDRFDRRRPGSKLLIDSRCRWMFPAAYGLCLAVISVRYGPF